jgi:hypothetical protein
MSITNPEPRLMATMRFTFLHALALLFVVTATSSAIDSLIDRLADGKIRPEPVAGLKVAYLPIVFPSSHSSNLLNLKNGDLVCTYYSGLWEDKSGVRLSSHGCPKARTNGRNLKSSRNRRE